MNPRSFFSRSSLVTFSCALAVAAGFLGTAPADAQEKKKIVFIAGKPSHPAGAHEHRAGSMLLADGLNKSGLPIEAVVVTNGWPQDPKVIEGAAAVVIYADGGKGQSVRQIGVVCGGDR